MQVASLLSGSWTGVVSYLSQVIDLEATARQFGAFQRPRKVRCAADLLRLALMYGPGQSSLRHTAALAGDAKIADLSDKAVLGRLRQCGDWLAFILSRLLQEKYAAPGKPDDALDLAFVDGSIICGPRRDGPKWRLHGRFDPGRGRFSDFFLSPDKVAERVERTKIDAGQTLIQDRGYARVRDFKAVLSANANFITRIGWRSLRLLNDAGEALNILDLLPQEDGASDHEVYVAQIERPLRLIIKSVPAEKADQQRKRVTRKSNKAGHKMDPRTVTTAGYVMLITSLPAQLQPAEKIASLYRNRWQVELGFKRLKSIGNIDMLPALDPNLARTWLLAHLIAAVLTDDIATEIVGFPPSEAAIQRRNLALAGLA